MIDSRIFVGILAVFISMIFIILLGINERDRMAEASAAIEGRSIQTGAKIFEDNCAPCHGNQGQGIPGRAPTLNSEYFFTQRLKDIGYTGSLPSYIQLTVAGGRPVKTSNEYSEVMPTWGQQYGGPLRPDQIENVTDFIMNWEATATGEGLPVAEVADDPVARGADAFNKQGCSACHTVAGYSTGAVGPELTHIYAEQGEDFVRQSILDPNAVIAEGFSENIMPQTFADVIPPEQLDDIIAFLKAASEQ